MSLSKLVTFSAFSLAAATEYVVAPAELAPSDYHPWAHSHWVWVHRDDSNQQNTTDLVDGYTSRVSILFLCFMCYFRGIMKIPCCV